MAMSTDQNSLSIPSCCLYSTFTACDGERLNLHKPVVMAMDCTSGYISAEKRWQTPKDVRNSAPNEIVLITSVSN